MKPAARSDPAAPRSAAPSRRSAWRSLLPAWADRDLRIVLGARLSMSAARAIAGVVVALYLAAEGFSAVEIGVLFLCVTVVSALVSTSVGLLSDRVGRKPFLVGVPMLAALAAAMFAVDRAPAVLFVFASLGSFGRGAGAGGGSVGPYQPAESAYVAEGVPRPLRAAAFGRLAFASSLGALVGGLMAGLAAARPHMSPGAALAAYRPAFVACAILAAAAGTAALWLSDRRRPAPPAGVAGPRVRLPRRSWPALWRLWVTNGTNGLAIGLVGPFLSYWLARRYGASPGDIGILFAIVNLGSLGASLAAAGIARRLGTVRAIVVVRAVTGLLMVPMALAPAFWLAGSIYFVRMLFQRVGLPLRQSFTQDLAHPDERSSVAALSNLPAQATMGLGQVVAGYLFQDVALAAPFEVGALFQCANALAYAVLFRAGKPRWRGGDGRTDAPGVPAATGVAAKGVPVTGPVASRQT